MHVFLVSLLSINGEVFFEENVSLIFRRLFPTRGRKFLQRPVFALRKLSDLQICNANISNA